MEEATGFGVENDGFAYSGGRGGGKGRFGQGWVRGRGRTRKGAVEGRAITQRGAVQERAVFEESATFELIDSFVNEFFFVDDLKSHGT